VRLKLTGQRGRLHASAFPVGRPSAAEMESFGQRALDAVGARLAAWFLGTALIGIPLAGAAHSGWLASAQVPIGLGTAGLASVLLRRRRNLWLVGAVAAIALGLGLSASAIGVIETSKLHAIAAWVVAGTSGGVAASRGLLWGLFTLVFTAGASLLLDGAHAGSVSLTTFLGALTYCLGAGGANILARRGFAATERTLAAIEAAEVALRVAEQRLNAHRAADRQLHDTLLATLTILAHRAVGVAPSELRRLCERDLAILQSGREPFDLPGSLASPGDEPVTTGANSIGSMLGLIVADGAARGLDVRLHASYELRGTLVEPHALAAVYEALIQCVANVNRHAFVAAFDLAVTASRDKLIFLVIDEGEGFDPARVPDDRLGLRASVRERLREVGGSVTVWSQPGQGTSVMLRLPTLAANRKPSVGLPPELR